MLESRLHFSSSSVLLQTSLVHFWNSSSHTVLTEPQVCRQAVRWSQQPSWISFFPPPPGTVIDILPPREAHPEDLNERGHFWTGFCPLPQVKGLQNLGWPPPKLKSGSAATNNNGAESKILPTTEHSRTKTQYGRRLADIAILFVVQYDYTVSLPWSFTALSTSVSNEVTNVSLWYLFSPSFQSRVVNVWYCIVCTCIQYSVW